jgi:hypothetical protein
MENQNDLTISLAKLNRISKINSGASWIRWIAILSILNSIVFSFGSNVSFIVGLGVTQLFTGVVDSFLDGNIVIILSLIFAVVVSGVFLILDYFARKSHLWAFWVAIVLYGFDSLIFLLIGDYLSFGFHLYAGFFIGVAIKELMNKSE